MKHLLREAMTVLRPLGYKKLGSRFFKIEHGFFKQVDFQLGAHGGYFFVNVCLHPVGLPELLAGALVIPDCPREHECIIRRRVEDVVLGSSTEAFRIGLVSIENAEAINQLLSSLSNVEAWLSKWASFSTILQASDLDLQQMLTAAPSVREKACKMLKSFCAMKLHKSDQAEQELRKFHVAPSGGYDFARVEEYLRSFEDQSTSARNA